MNKQSSDFNSAKLENFIEEPGFILWVTNPDHALDTFWHQVQKDFPATIPIIAEARKMVLSIRFESEEMAPGEQQLLWRTIEAEAHEGLINADKRRYIHEKPIFRLPLWLRSVAAVLLAGLVGLSLFYMNYHQTIEVDTAYGQRRTLTLPDGSVVTVNANSKLRYAKNWSNNDVREVWIEGEAFFKVSHLHKSGTVVPGERFIVHAQQLNVEVLGTTFDVHNRRGLVKVALLSGSVKLNVEDKDEAEKNRTEKSSTGKTNPANVLKPGDLAEYSIQKQTIFRKQINTTDYASWRSGLLVVNNIKFSELAMWIEDNYGYKVILQNPEIGQRRLTGRITLSSEANFFNLIATTMGISIERNQSAHQLIIK